jgi:hypothetical protein
MGDDVCRSGQNPDNEPATVSNDPVTDLLRTGIACYDRRAMPTDGKERKSRWRTLGGTVVGIATVAGTLGLGTSVGSTVQNSRLVHPGVTWIERNILGEEPSPPELLDTLDAALPEAQSGRARLNQLITSVRTCRTTPSAAASQAANIGQDLRTGVMRDLGDVSTAGVRHGAQLLTQFRAAMRLSAAADQHYAEWMQSTGSEWFHNGAGECGPKLDAGRTARQAFVDESGEATDAKRRFTKLYNPVAQDAGLGTWRYDEF